MVSRKNVSRFDGEAPGDDKAPRKIADGPLYPAEEVLQVLEKSGEEAVIAWTNKCQGDMQKWSLDSEDLCELVRIAVKSGRFRGSEWCVQRPDGPWAACDAYSLARREWIPNAYKEMDIEYYIKFAIAKSGKLLLVVSCHLSENKW